MYLEKTIMRNQVKQIEEKVVALVKKTRLGDILPFAEKPSVSPEQKDPSQNQLEASELFSLFTANIIKEDVVFTR
jgi:hypothetical protein